MTRATTKPVTFEQFLEVCPDDGIYELVDGEIVKLEPTRAHQKVAEFISDSFKAEARRCNLDYFVTGKVVVRVQTKTGFERGRNPDVGVIDEALWDEDLSSYSALREPFQLAVEVASTNWRDDYIDKVDEYQRLGILEYWIVDYLALASAEYLGQSKVPTVSVYQLIEGQYKATQFRGQERIVSNTFPELELTVAQIVAASLPRHRF